MTQELNCRGCGIKTVVNEFYIQIDEQRVRVNVDLRIKYDEEMKNYNSLLDAHNKTVELYKSIVTEHNAHKYFWQSEWKFEEDSTSYGTRIECGGLRVRKYPKIWKPEHPKLEQKFIHYITCPVCYHRFYIRKETYESSS